MQLLPSEMKLLLLNMTLVYVFFLTICYAMHLIFHLLWPWLPRAVMDRSSQPGPELTTLEAVGDQWWCALVVVQAGDDDDDDDDDDV